MSATPAIRTIISIDGTDGKFEWYQYNEDLRIIHSVEDDMFHAQSILRALGSTKDLSNWRRLKQTEELLQGFTSIRKFTDRQLITEHSQFNNVKCIRGTYIHRLLVNCFAMWASPRYAYKIAVLLDDHFELRRQVEENRALEAEKKSLLQKVDEQAIRIEKLMKENERVLKKLDYSIEQNDDLLDRMDTIHTHVESMSPIATSLKNRVSTISDEHLLVYADTDEEDVTRIKIHAVNTSTMRARGYKPEDAIAYIKGGNTVNVQNELYRLILERGMNLGNINRKEKSFTIRRIDLGSLQRLINNELNSRINTEKDTLSDATKTLTAAAPKRAKKQTTFMGFPVEYCKQICCKWNISKKVLTEIINDEWVYKTDYKTILLHKSKGILYRTRVNGKVIYRPVPTTYFLESGEDI